MYPFIRAYTFGVKLVHEQPFGSIISILLCHISILSLQVFFSLGSILELGCDVDVEDFPKKTWLMDKQRRIGGDALLFILGVGQAWNLSNKLIGCL